MLPAIVVGDDARWPQQIGRVEALPHGVRADLLPVVEHAGADAHRRAGHCLALQVIVRVDDGARAGVDEVHAHRDAFVRVYGTHPVGQCVGAVCFRIDHESRAVLVGNGLAGALDYGDCLACAEPRVDVDGDALMDGAQDRDDALCADLANDFAAEDRHSLVALHHALVLAACDQRVVVDARDVQRAFAQHALDRGVRGAKFLCARGRRKHQAFFCRGGAEGEKRDRGEDAGAAQSCGGTRPESHWASWAKTCNLTQFARRERKGFAVRSLRF